MNISRILRLRGLGQGVRADQEMEEPNMLNATLTFYNGLDDEYGATTARANPEGVCKAIHGLTIAVDPAIIPYGSRVHIPDLAGFSRGGDGVFYAHDTGSAVKARTASLRRGSVFPVIDVYADVKTNAELLALNAKYGMAVGYEIVAPS